MTTCLHISMPRRRTDENGWGGGVEAMTTNVDVWVPDAEAAPRVRHALRSVSGISLRTSLSEHGTWTFLVVFVDRLGADWWTTGEDRIRWTWESALHPVCPVFIGSFGVGK